MGKVVVTAEFENVFDLESRARGMLPDDQVRRITVTNALVDTGATSLMLPRTIIKDLGLRQFATERARGIGGTVEAPLYSAVRLSIQDRECTLDVGEVPDDFPPLIGQVPLELMDWVVDPGGRRLVGNPEHGGEHILEVFMAVAPRLSSR